MLKAETDKSKLFIEAAIFLNQLNCGNAEEPRCLMSAPLHDSSLRCSLIEITALMGFEEEQLERMFITSREDVPNGKSNATFLERSRQWQHLKVSPSQSVNFNEHPDLIEWKLISQFMHNFQRSLNVCVVVGKKWRRAIHCLTINQLSKTIVLQSCSDSLIWPLEYSPHANKNWSNLTRPVLICWYSDAGKLEPTTRSGCIFFLSPYESDTSYTCTFCKTGQCSSCCFFKQWVYWSCPHRMMPNYWAGKLEDELMLFIPL